MNQNTLELTWPQRTWGPLPVQVGLCAWSARLLAHDKAEGVAYIKRLPSLVVIEPEDSDQVVEATAEVATELPILIRVKEPDFVRRFEAKIRQRMALLNAKKVSAIALTVEDAAELKSGGLLQVLFELRAAKLFDHLILATEHVEVARWLSANTAAGGIMLSYSLADQMANYHALPMVQEMGQAAIAYYGVPNDDRSLAFALGESPRVLPVLDRRLPSGLTVMTPREVADVWAKYQSEHEPPKLARDNQPPE